VILDSKQQTANRRIEMTTTYTVTDRTGRVHKRKSKDRTYTHAVVFFHPAVPATETYSGREAFSSASWCGSYELARKQARDDYEIIEIPAAGIRVSKQSTKREVDLNAAYEAGAAFAVAKPEESAFHEARRRNLRGHEWSFFVRGVHDTHRARVLAEKEGVR
jgi:hypothetical protein